eukprot:UN18514
MVVLTEEEEILNNDNATKNDGKEDQVLRQEMYDLMGKTNVINKKSMIRLT